MKRPDGGKEIEFPAYHLHVTPEGHVWLNTEVANYDGLCIGFGDTPEASLANAVQTLERALECLQAPPDAWKES